MSGIDSWKKFEKHVRRKDGKLLRRLDDFPNAILIAGCQRSGTTMLARVITESDGIRRFWFGVDPCMDAGLILSGHVEHDPHGRHCFQTTHVDECYQDYLVGSRNYQMIWCIRNPRSVVYSMIYNWSAWALDVTFRRCGASGTTLNEVERRRYQLLGARGLPKHVKAAAIYNTKIDQLFELRPHLNSRQLLVVDYDDLVVNKHHLLPKIYDYLGLQYRQSYAEKILATSTGKATNLRQKEAQSTDQRCAHQYARARALCLS